MRRLLFPISGTFTFPAYLRPDADDIDGGWTTEGGTSDLYASIEETVPLDADFIRSSDQPANDMCKIRLSNPAGAPKTPMSVRYRAAKSADATGVMTMRVRLLQGTTEIARWDEPDLPTAFTTVERQLSNEQFASITDFNDLYVDLLANYVAPPAHPPNTILPGPAGFSGAYLNVKDYGALGNGVANDQTAIQNAMNAANAQGRGLWFPAGTYLHSGNLNMTSIHVNGDGYNSTNIRSTSATGSTAIQMYGTSPKLSNVTVSTTWSGGRLSAGWQTAVFIDLANGYHVDHVYVLGSPSAGIMSYGAINGKITNCTVRNTLADAIHHTNNAHDDLVDRCFIENAGDDGIAVVSYSGQLCQNITVTNNVVLNNQFGRMLTVIGGRYVTQDNNFCNGNPVYAGLLWATEPAYSTPGVSDVECRNSTFYNAGSNTSGHGVGMCSAPSGYAQVNNRLVVRNCIFGLTGGRTGPGLKIDGPNNQNVQFINYQLIGCSLVSGSGLITNQPWTSGPVGYTPVKCGVDNAFHHNL